MTSVPSNLSRVPNALVSRVSLANMNRTNARLLTIQTQLSTGRAIQRPSDDVVKGTLIGVLNDQLSRATRVRRNLSHAGAALGVLDSVLDEANGLAVQAKAIGLDQGQSTSDATQREGQAIVVDQLISSMLSLANRQGVAGYVMGGSTTSTQPFVSMLGGVRYVGQGSGLLTDLGATSGVPITLGAGNPLAATSARVRGSVDLNPGLTGDTRLSDLGGARGLGVSPGTLEFSFDGGAHVSIDLAGADTVQDAVTRVTAALRQYETDNSVTVLGPGGVSFSGGSLTIDVAPGSPTNPTLEFFDAGSGTTAKDLGLTAQTPFSFVNGSANGLDLAAKLTWRTPLSAMQGLTLPLGTFRLRNAGQSAVVDLSGAQTLQDVKNAIEATNLGVRVQINADAAGIDVLNDLSTSSAQSMSIEEISGQNLTATKLGIRTFSPETRVGDFNFGRGVRIVDGATDPTTGLVDPALNTDMRITLGDSARTTIDIDLRPQDMGTVQTLLARINSQIADGLTAAGLPANSLVAGLSDGGNGIRLTQDAGFPNALALSSLNNSSAADDLGLIDGTYDAASATFAGTDRAKVRVGSVFSDLLDLSAALRGNDTSGIQLATQSLEGSISGLIETRGTVGAYARRVDDADAREQDLATLNEQVRSGLQDVDFAQAASEFALLQSQLTAGLQTAAMTSQLSLLDFLG